MAKYTSTLIGLSLAAALVPWTAGQVGKKKDDLGRSLVPPQWYESTAAIVRVSINQRGSRPAFPIDPAKAGPVLDDYKARGITAIEIFAPYHGGNSYGGLDSIDRFRINPKLGTMEDFRKLVRLIHSKGMAVVSFDNLGYCSSEAPEFLKAADDVRAGRDTAEARRFLWADRADAPPPVITKDKFFMVRPTHLPTAKPGVLYDSTKAEFWEFNERAGKYFWTKWLGPNLSGKVVRLPQYNWGSEEFQQYAEKVVRFWMDQGLDGMIIDAVNWYIGHTWEQDRQRMTNVIRSYGNAYSQPEGGGAFHEDPVGWIQDGGWSSVQNYGLSISWEKWDVIGAALDKGDPRPLEQALRDYHDRVVAAGGVLYFRGGGGGGNPERQRFSRAIVASLGEIVGVSPPNGPTDEEWAWLLKTKSAHKALHNMSTRRRIPTRADDKHYAFLRTAKDGSERVLVVMNFQPTAQTVEVDLSGVATAGLVELKSGETVPRGIPLSVQLPAYGYRFYQVKPAVVAKVR